MTLVVITVHLFLTNAVIWSHGVEIRISKLSVTSVREWNKRG